MFTCTDGWEIQALVELLADRFSQLTQRDADFAVTTILEAMNSAMVRGQRIEVRGFGSFSIMHRTSRVGRNPRSGDPVAISGKRVPHFKPGKVSGRFMEAQLHDFGCRSAAA